MTRTHMTLTHDGEHMLRPLTSSHLVMCDRVPYSVFDFNACQHYKSVSCHQLNLVSNKQDGLFARNGYLYRVQTWTRPHS